MESAESIIYKLVSEQKLSPQDATQLFNELDGNKKSTGNDIAVIGMSCRFPKADSIDEYWYNLKNGINCIDQFPAGRVKDALESASHISGDEEDIFLKGGYLLEVDKFDPGFFKISPQVAKWIEPSQRLFLVTAMEAIEDAGYTEKMISGTNTGVYVGIDHTYRQAYGENSNEKEFSSRTGSWTSILAGRVAYAFNLHGPTLVIDTACSAALVAIHTACKSIILGECDLAIAGGVNFLLAPTKDNNLEMVQSGDNTVRAFDKNANGTVWGEGIAAIMLKPLEKAIADNDNIYAVVKGGAINNDGASGAITAPNAEAQEDVLIKAWEDAGINPVTISYIEAHGTGTKLGDPVEIKGLANAFKHYTDKKQFCGIGSVKSSIGHLVGASGIASIIKVILSIKYGEIPASINFKEPNPYINFCDSPVFVNDKLREWKTDGSPRRAGVSAFAFSGTNCHLVLEEAPHLQRKMDEYKGMPSVITLSAKNEDSLPKLVAKYTEFIKGHPELLLEDICFTATTGRGHYNYRIAMLVNDYGDLVKKLERISTIDLRTLSNEGVYYGIVKVVSNSAGRIAPDEISEIEIQKASDESEVIVQKIMSSPHSEYAGLLSELCRLYIKGAEITWEKILKGSVAKRISLPGYIMKNTRCWVETNDPPYYVKKRTEEGKKSEEHPLLGVCLAENMFNITYQCELSSETHWVLSDHKIIQRNILPGTAYVEIAREACGKCFGEAEVELRDLIFLEPLMFSPWEAKQLQTLIIKKEAAQVEFIICSRLEDSWVKHAEGKACRMESKEHLEFDIAETRSRLGTVIDKSEVKEKTEVSEFGPRWNNIEEIHASSNEMLIKLALPKEFSSDTEKYGIHPALLDNVANMAIRLSDNKNYYLPFLYKSFKIYGKVPDIIYGYVKNKGQIIDGNEIIAFDILLVNSRGDVVGEIKDYTIKKVHLKDFRLNQSERYYETHWIEKGLVEKKASAGNSNILIFKDRQGVSDKLIRLLRNSGKRVIEVISGDRYEKVSNDSFVISGEEQDYYDLLAEIVNENVSQIVHMMTLSKQSHIQSMGMLNENQKLGTWSLFYLVRALVENRYNHLIDIVLLSEYANEVDGNEEWICPGNAAFFGLGKVVAQEYHNLKCRCIDIDENTSENILFHELDSGMGEYIAAFRNGLRYIEEFNKVKMDTKAERNFKVKSEGVYVISGGLGGIGLEIGKYLASKDNVNLCLINRSGLPPRDEWESIQKNDKDKKLNNRINAIIELENMGAYVQYYSANVSNEHELKSVFDDLREKFGRINGVFHCAGIAGDGFIIKKEKDEFERVLAPKIQGAWLLDKLTSQDDMDIFVLFSSIYTLIGGPGQSDYCAANSYLDSFTAYRNKLGRRTITINWPGWKEIGMAVEYGVSEISGIFKTISTENAIRAFDEMVNRDISRVFVGEFDYEAMNYLIDVLQVNFSDDVKDLLNKKINHIRATSGNSKKELADDVLITGKEESEFSENEKKLGKIWAHVLGLDEINTYTTFQDLGGDSIIASSLSKELENHFPGELNISDIFTYPSVNDMAKHLDRKMNQQEEVVGVFQDEDNIDSLLERLSKGDISVDTATKLFNIE